MKKIIVLLFFVLLLTACTPKGEVNLVHGVDTVEVFGSHDLMGCVVTIDEVDYQMSIVSNSIDLDTIGEYLVEYSYEDGNRDYVCQRVVFVVDQTSPILTLLPGRNTIYTNETWIDGGVEVADNYDQELAVEIIENTLDITTPGTYQVTYQATDDSGNTSQITRFVHVLESD